MRTILSITTAGRMRQFSPISDFQVPDSGTVEEIPIAGVINTCGGDRFFLFADVDRFVPPQYLVTADSFEEAYETFLDAKGKRLDEASCDDMRAEYGNDVGDWPEVQYIDGGDLVHSGGVQGSEVEFRS